MEEGAPKDGTFALTRTQINSRFPWIIPTRSNNNIASKGREFNRSASACKIHSYNDTESVWIRRDETWIFRRRCKTHSRLHVDTYSFERRFRPNYLWGGNCSIFLKNWTPLPTIYAQKNDFLRKPEEEQPARRRVCATLHFSTNFFCSGDPPNGRNSWAVALGCPSMAEGCVILKNCAPQNRTRTIGRTMNVHSNNIYNKRKTKSVNAG